MSRAAQTPAASRRPSSSAALMQANAIAVFRRHPTRVAGRCGVIEERLVDPEIAIKQVLGEGHGRDRDRDRGEHPRAPRRPSERLQRQCRPEQGQAEAGVEPDRRGGIEAARQDRRPRRPARDRQHARRADDRPEADRERPQAAFPDRGGEPGCGGGAHRHRIALRLKARLRCRRSALSSSPSRSPPPCGRDRGSRPSAPPCR